MPTANGNVPVERSVLPEDALLATDTTVQRMMELAEGEYGMRSPRIRALAINIVRDAKVREKDYYGEILAIHRWVKRNIRYMKDPVNQETLSHPEELAFNTRAGDCDDMTILEIALLGSIGIQAWPVVIGVAPGIPSHVYLRARVPPGGHRKAGKVINLDPIMKDWAAGREAPAHKVKIAHDYRDGNYMQGIQRYRNAGSNNGSNHMSDLGDPYSMLPGMGAYVQSESYLDTEHSHAQELLKPDLAESTGSVGNAPKASTVMEGIDGLFGGMGDVVDVGIPARHLGPLGPMTGRAFRKETRVLDSVQPREISAKAYEVPVFNAALNNKRGKAATTMVDSRTHVVAVQNGANQAAKAAKSPIEERQELAGLMGILGELQTTFLPGIGTMGADDRLEVAERAATIGWWARLKSRLAAARAGWYQERAAQARLHKARLAEEHARQGLMQERQNAQRADQVAATASAVTHQMARMDPAMAEAIAETEESLNASGEEALQIDGLLGLSEDDLNWSSAIEQNAEVGVRAGRRARPAQTARAQRPVTAQERQQIHLRRHRQIAEDKTQRMQAAGRRRRGAVRRQRRRDRGPQIMTPIQATSVRDPQREGRTPMARSAHAVQRVPQQEKAKAMIASSRSNRLRLSGMGSFPPTNTWLLVAAAAAAGLYIAKRS